MVVERHPVVLRVAIDFLRQLGAIVTRGECKRYALSASIKKKDGRACRVLSSA
jgi:hypothetical protein